MPAFQKRKMSDSPSPQKKKKVDSVHKQIAVITDALEDDSFEVPGTSANRRMLIAMAPAVLEAPVDERNENQKIVAEMFKELFAAEEARLSQQVAEAEAKVSEVNKELSSRKASTSNAEVALKEKGEQVKSKLAELADKVGVTRTAESTFKELVSDLTDLEQTQSFATEEKEATLSLKTNPFLPLKEGTWEGDTVNKDDVKTLTSFFRKIKADSSMVSALPMALGRKPAERSEFDSVVVGELDKKLEGKLEELEQTIKGNAAEITKKNALKDSADASLTTAKARQRADTEAVLALKAEAKQLSSELSEKQQAVVEQGVEMKAADGELLEKKSNLETHQKISSDLTALLERTAPIPEVAVEEKTLEVVTEEVM